MQAKIFAKTFAKEFVKIFSKLLAKIIAKTNAKIFVSIFANIFAKVLCQDIHHQDHESQGASCDQLVLPALPHLHLNLEDQQHIKISFLITHGLLGIESIVVSAHLHLNLEGQQHVSNWSHMDRMDCLHTNTTTDWTWVTFPCEEFSLPLPFDFSSFALCSSQHSSSSSSTT